MVDSASATTPADRTHCAACGCEVKAYSTCDREDTGAVWCFDCFPDTPCGKGYHGEGCATNVFEDGEPATAAPVHWRCFHCDETFTKAQARWAREHFGAEGDTPVCLMRVPGEGSLLTALRNAQEELERYRAEDSDLMRALASQASDHGAAVRKAEEDGYAKALRDIEAGKIEPDHARRIVTALEGLQRG